jgi:arylsulfatase
LLVLIDDLGFAGTSAFGGPVTTPNFDQIANEGLRYNNFHTTAVCSPTRAALKSGRNHHVANMGGIIETGTAFPGNTGQIPNNVAPLDRWPTHQGFDKFYGFLGGEINQWAPFIYDGVATVQLPDDPSYHFLTDIWIARSKGKFDQGWDKLREEILARQIQTGMVPEGTVLAPKPEAIPDWDTLSADEKRLFTRHFFRYPHSECS